MRKAIKICLWWVSALAVTAVVAAQSMPGCLEKCGQVEIPYPFGVSVQSGTGNNCFFEEAFHVDCKNSTLFHGNEEISSISLQGHMDMWMPVSRVCFNDTGGAIGKIGVSLSTPVFIISSSENKFLSVGCDTYGYLNSFQNNHSYSTGCLTRCNGVPDQQSDGTCSGIGCCQVDIPLGMRNISIEAYSFNLQRKASDFNNCSYAFVAKEGWFNFSTADLRSLLFKKAPLVVDWAISDGTCESERTSPDYACKSNTLCEDSGYGFGYRCRCKPGFEGNPYLPDGCRDIDECKESAHNCTSEDNCRNTVGSYECYCPRAYTGTGTKETGCHPPWRRNPLSILLIVASVGLVVLFVSMAWLYLINQKRKLMKQKDRFFRQNGGAILQQKLSVKQGPSSLTAKIFTAQELIKATDNFHDSLVIGRGGFGTVYRGILLDNTVVAIKKSKLVDQSQIEQFINEVIILSQINHRNVVKLLGCCLETEVPLLVYEFINNGTLFESIHDKRKASVFTWETRLTIAAEVAGALSYLHSAASIPIIHRDVKSANILLDETCTAKVSDFGASRLLALDQMELATMVQGTFGYLDPEYMQTNQLTDKSDVYSFGVVILELLTGRKALLFDGPEEERSLAMHFLSSLDEGRLFEVVERGMVSDGNKKAVNEVAVLAARCLRLKGDERPSMKEVAMELEGIRMMGRHPWSSKHLNAEESHSLLPQPSRFTESVDSIVYINTAWDSIIDRGLFDLDEYGR